MTQQETIDRVLVEIQTHSIPASDDYIPTRDHYIPARMFEYYASLLYSAGYDEGRLICAGRGHTVPIEQIKDGKVICTWPSATEAARKLKMNVQSIWRITNKIKGNKTYKGYEWRKVNQSNQNQIEKQTKLKDEILF